MLMGRWVWSIPLNFIGTSPWISTGFGSVPNTFIFFTQALLTCNIIYFIFFFWGQDVKYVFSVDVRIFTTSLITHVLGVGQKDGHFHNTDIHLLLNLRIYQLVYSAGFSCRMNIFSIAICCPRCCASCYLNLMWCPEYKLLKIKNKIYAQKKQRKEESVSSVKFTFSSLGIIKVFSEHQTYIVSLRKKLQ